jgi:hypothetical protein
MKFIFWIKNSTDSCASYKLTMEVESLVRNALVVQELGLGRYTQCILPDETELEPVTLHVFGLAKE